MKYLYVRQSIYITFIPHARESQHFGATTAAAEESSYLRCRPYFLVLIAADALQSMFMYSHYSTTQSVMSLRCCCHYTLAHVTSIYDTQQIHTTQHTYELRMYIVRMQQESGIQPLSRARIYTFAMSALSRKSCFNLETQKPKVILNKIMNMVSLIFFFQPSFFTLVLLHTQPNIMTSSPLYVKVSNGLMLWLYELNNFRCRIRIFQFNFIFFLYSKSHDGFCCNKIQSNQFWLNVLHRILFCSISFIQKRRKVESETLKT